MPDSIDKQYYKIRDAAEIIGVAPSTLRYWESEFSCLSPMRTASKARHYTPEDIEKLRKIHYLLKVKGLKLEAAKEQMRVNARNIDHTMEVIARLEEVKSGLKGLLGALGKRAQDNALG